MPDVPSDGGTPGEGAREARARVRRKQAADTLGDLLPDQTRDDSAAAWGERDDSAREEELLRDVPPHHG